MIEMQGVNDSGFLSCSGYGEQSSFILGSSPVRRRMKSGSGSKRAFIRIVAFVDWNSQLLRHGKELSKDPVTLARHTLKMMARHIAGSLARHHSDNRFQVFLRLYHGWHKGYEPTPNRKAITKAISEADFSTLSHKPDVIFSPEVAYGDYLLSALPERLNKKLHIHLPNTVRDREPRGLEEKMVDTALASDIIVSAYRDPEDWIMVVSDDDDFIPPLFVAESIIKPKESRALLLGSRVRSKNLLKLDKIAVS
ncbi:TPA: NYN domain-containing protein [Pseudomonas aeruginosa]|uniref:NYN domain-containing protein n=1 Tax=Pseudomonas aeruginosa TaxID=287 RepID=UPI000F82C7A1|nr:NYN domain-containing protein [Pseudomonas aeruginosa]RTW74887.1 NYN domain-containing protein [Pseudomonas aeruginosa]